MSIIKYLYIGLISIGVVGVSSCSEELMSDINKNVNQATDVQAKFILADAITNTAFNNVGGDLNTYLSTYVEHYGGVHGQMFNAENRDGEPQVAGTFNNKWVSLYRGLRDAKIIVAKCSPGGAEEGNNVTRGMGEVLAAYNLGLLTDMFGDVPYTEAINVTLTKTPVLDKQELIYEDILKYLDSAIENLQKTDIQGAGGYDLLFAGNKTKWLKFAYGLRARYTLHKIHRSGNKMADYQSIISDLDKSFTSAADEAAFNVYTGTNVNPTFDFQSSRRALAASRSFVDKLIERNDPRLTRFFIDKTKKQLSTIETNDANYELLPKNGDVADQIQNHYVESLLLYAKTASTLLMSYHEVQFIRAEVLQRLGRPSTEVESALKSAIQAAIVNAEKSIASALANGTYTTNGTSAINTAQIDDYFTNSVKPRFTANALKEIATQKYIGLLGASGETTEIYNDIRRWKALGENLIELKNTKPFPLRLPYGSSETTTNPNVQNAFGDGQYVYSENVWWAGGTR